MATVRIKDRPENRDMLSKISYCSAIPKFEGFKFCDGYIELSFEDVENRPIHITEKAFIQFFKDVYEGAIKGISIGPVDPKNVFVKKEKIIVIPTFKEEVSVVNGRIENPSSFFTTIRTFAQAFKGASPFLMKVFKEGIPAILEIMKSLNLDIPSTPLFLPSIGVWRHGPILEKIQSDKGFITIPINDGGVLSKFLEGQTFSSIEEIIDHLKENPTFSPRLNFDSADPSALAFFFKTEENETYIFNCGESVEMVTFVKAFVKFKKGLKVIAIHDPIFDFEDGKRVEFPVISPKELDWFFNTFFTSDFVFEGDVKALFEISKGENFAISKLVREGKWKFEEDKWHVMPKIPSKPSAACYLLKAHELMRTGEKPYLGLELVNTASRIADRSIESVESARAFFHKVLGEYEIMINDLKRANAFGNRTFRNAYFGVVMAMNGFDPVLSEESTSPFIETCRKYVQLVKNGEDYDKIYEQIIHPLENFKEQMARRIEVMARNYVGILHLRKMENEEAIDEFETALSIAREENFRDLIPLIEMNIGYTLLKNSPRASKERLEIAMKEAVEEGLWKTFLIINLTMAENFVEMGNFSKARESLDLVKFLSDDFSAEVESLRSRMMVENLDFDASNSKTSDEMMLKFIKYIYMDDEKNALETLKLINSEDGEYLRNIANDPLKIVETIAFPQIPFAIYFVSRLKSARALKMMKKYGEKLYREGFLTNAIFYEEQLAKLYKLFGWQKSADLHFAIASNIAQSLGLKNRANEIKKRLKDLQGTLELLNATSSCLYSINFESTNEVIESLAIDLSKHVESEVLCRMHGIEEIGYICDKNGISYQTDEDVKGDSWIIDDEKFVYDFSIRGGEVFIQIDKTNVDLDKAMAILDAIVPIYKLKLEKVIASKISDLDQLTGVYTRRYIFERLSEEVERAKRYKEFLSVAMIDIDNFKRINDTYGHDVGDEVLKKVSETLRMSTRKIDIIGRYGGEEFLVIFPHTPLEQSMKGAQRMLKNVRENFKWMKLTISIGIAEIIPTCNTMEQIVKCADIALYRAKLAGKNRIVKYSESEV